MQFFRSVGSRGGAFERFDVSQYFPRSRGGFFYRPATMGVEEPCDARPELASSKISPLCGLLAPPSTAWRAVFARRAIYGAGSAHASIGLSWRGRSLAPAHSTKRTAWSPGLGPRGLVLGAWPPTLRDKREGSAPGAGPSIRSPRGARHGIPRGSPECLLRQRPGLWVGQGLADDTGGGFFRRTAPRLGPQTDPRQI